MGSPLRVVLTVEVVLLAAQAVLRLIRLCRPAAALVKAPRVEAAATTSLPKSIMSVPLTSFKAVTYPERLINPAVLVAMSLCATRGVGGVADLFFAVHHHPAHSHRSGVICLLLKYNFK